MYDQCTLGIARTESMASRFSARTSGSLASTTTSLASPDGGCSLMLVRVCRNSPGRFRVQITIASDGSQLSGIQVVLANGYAPLRCWWEKAARIEGRKPVFSTT